MATPAIPHEYVYETSLYPTLPVSVAAAQE
jgi:hypothetical protein